MLTLSLVKHSWPTLPPPATFRDPVVVTPTRQDFEGLSYYLCGKYFANSAKASSRRLHQTVWSAAHGPIPPGYHVHHRDEDRANNRLDNLELKWGSDHLADHMTPERRAQSALCIVTHGVPAARAWHSTPEGLAWHSKNGKAAWETRDPIALTCQECGSTYETRGRGDRLRFCSGNCRARALRRSPTIGTRQHVEGMCPAQTRKGLCVNWPKHGQTHCRWHSSESSPSAQQVAPPSTD